MNNKRLLLGLLFLIIILAAAMIIAWTTLSWLRDFAGSLDSPPVFIVAVGCIVILSAALVLSQAIRRAAHEFCDRRTERARLFEALMASLATGSPPPEHGLFLTASPAVLQEYLAVRKLVETGPESVARRKQITRLLLALRRDLGEPTFSMEQDDLSPWLSGVANQPIEKKAPADQPPQLTPTPFKMAFDRL